MIRYSIEPRAGKYVKGYGCSLFGRNLSNKYWKQLLDAATKIALDALKTATKQVAHKKAEATEKLIWNKIDNKIVKPKPVPEVNWANVEEIVIPPEKREQILNELRQVSKNGTL